MLLNFSIILLFIWLGIITFFLIRFTKTFARLTKGVSDKDLKQILEEVIDQIKKSYELEEDLKKSILHLAKEDLNHIQKIGLIRYNPFSETGGNQSFVLALLDGHDCGFVITSLHSRESTRVFAKPVTLGKESGFEFSKEEIQAIVTAQRREKTGKK